MNDKLIYFFVGFIIGFAIAAIRGYFTHVKLLKKFRNDFFEDEVKISKDNMKSYIKK